MAMEIGSTYGPYGRICGKNRKREESGGKQVRRTGGKRRAA